jgi:uncharacterized membrane protein
MIFEADKMTCSHCLAEMPEISRFCPVCGRRVDGEDALLFGHRREAVLGALAYVLAVPAIVLLVVPALKASRFLRFHSWQSLLFLIASALLAVAVRVIFVILSVFSWVGFLLAWLCAGVAALAIVVLWAVLVAKAAQGESYELPLIGSVAERLAGESL